MAKTSFADRLRSLFSRGGGDDDFYDELADGLVGRLGEGIGPPNEFGVVVCVHA